MVVIDEAADRVIASAKSLTTRPDLALGVGRAIDAAIAEAMQEVPNIDA